MNKIILIALLVLSGFSLGSARLYEDFDESAITLISSNENHAPNYWDHGNVIRDQNHHLVSTDSLKKAKIICAALEQCYGIFEVKGNYTAGPDSVSYEQGSFYFFRNIHPVRVPVTAGIVHQVKTKNYYNRSRSHHAPGYWDNDFVFRDYNGSMIAFDSIESAQEECYQRENCQGVFEVNAPYNGKDNQYTAGMSYIFKRISPTDAGNVIAGVIHTKKNLPRNEDIPPLQGLADYLSSDERDPMELHSWSRLPMSKLASKVAQKAIWEDYKNSVISERFNEVFEKKGTIGGKDIFEMTINGKTMPYVKSIYGQAPKEGRPLLIMLHGGGSGTPEQNENNWRGFLTPYRPDNVPELKNAITVSPRSVAPAWNMWWLDHVDDFMDRIITNMIVFHHVNPNRIYLTGYSAGGDGLYHLGPRMADRWAGALMSAGHPNGAEKDSLFNTCFAIAMGKRDHSYDRYNVAVKWHQGLMDLKKEFGGYENRAGFYDTGHGMGNKEKAEVSWMMNCQRKSHPRKIIWNMRRHSRFYWLKGNDLSPGKPLTVERRGNDFIFDDVPNGATLKVRLNDSMIDFSNNVVFKDQDGTVLSSCQPQRTIETLYKTTVERGEPIQVYSGECEVRF